MFQLILNTIFCVCQLMYIFFNFSVHLHSKISYVSSFRKKYSLRYQITTTPPNRCTSIFKFCYSSIGSNLFMYEKNGNFLHLSACLFFRELPFSVLYKGQWYSFNDQQLQTFLTTSFQQFFKKIRNLLIGFQFPFNVESICRSSHSHLNLSHIFPVKRKIIQTPY